MSTVSNNVFKFVSLRPPINFDYAKDNLNFIRDNRLNSGPYSADEEHDIVKDEQMFNASDVGRLAIQKVKEHLSNLTKFQEIKMRNDMIVEDIKSAFNIIEKVNQNSPHIGEFIRVIKKQILNFDREILIEELNNIVRNFGYTGIKSYVDRVLDNDLSGFCIDYYYLFDRLYALYVCKRSYTINLEYVIEGLRALHVILWLTLELPEEGVSTTSTNTTTNMKSFRPQPQNQNHKCAKNILQEVGKIDPIPINHSTLTQLFNATPIIHQLFACLINYYKPFNYIKPIGIGDLLVVKQFLCKYEAGEIAHVENVLQGESRGRSHRRLDKSEDIFSTSTEKTEETEKDLQTTDRYELSRETESTIQSDLSAEVSGSVSGKYGTVEYTVNAGVSYSTSSSDSTKSSSNFAKDIVDRSLSKIKKSVREERTTKKLTEIEEINKHDFENQDGSNITGIYRWLDKHYKAQVYNYGKRLMFEFVIPEPAAFIMAAFERNKKLDLLPNRPVKPDFPSIKISELDKTKASEYASRYNMSGNLDPQLPDSKPVSQTFAMSDLAHDKPFTGEKIINIPDGYTANSIQLSGNYEVHDKDKNGIFFTAGGVTVGQNENDVTPHADHRSFNGDIPLDSAINGNLNLGVFGYNIKAFTVSVMITSNITEENQMKWKIKTYNAIMDAYQKLLDDYNSNMTAYEAKLESMNAAKESQITGLGERVNQEIIKTELKKHCITMFTKQFDTDNSDDDEFDAMQSRIETMYTDSTDEAAVKDSDSLIGTTLFTIRASEKLVTESPDYGIAGYLYTNQVPGTVPLYRLRRNVPFTIDLFYTSNVAERNSAINSYHYEDDGTGYVYQSHYPGTVPLYRLSRPEGQHFYTTSAKERDSIVTNLKYKYEGIEGYLYVNPILDVSVPAINIEESKSEGRVIQFIEQAFEWPQITYLLYPYFWGRMPEKWFDAQKYHSEEDAWYGKFLQAGSVRVLIAVRPAYETAVMHYLCTREPWNGGPAPGIDHPLYIPIHEELRNQQDDLNGAIPFGTPWEVIIPTSIVYLQQSSELPQYECNPPSQSLLSNSLHADAIRVKVFLEKIEVDDENDSRLKGHKKIEFEVRALTNNYGGFEQIKHVPKQGNYKISSGKPFDIQETIFDGLVFDHLAIKINARDTQSSNPDEDLGTYIRIFSGNSAKWLGKYTPDDETIDPESVGPWKIFYHIERV